MFLPEMHVLRHDLQRQSARSGPQDLAKTMKTILDYNLDPLLPNLRIPVVRLVFVRTYDEECIRVCCL